MLAAQRMTDRWFGLLTGGRSAYRISRRRACREWAVESLEGRTLLSTYTVASPADSGTGTLRWAINQANQDQSDDTIRFDRKLSGQTISLTSGVLSIRKASGTLAIRGSAFGPTTISASRHGEVFSVAPVSTVTISRLTITGGVGEDGGGIINGGKLTLTDDTISGNSALGGNGGGIDNQGFGTLTITGSTISGNFAHLAAGGIANAGTMTIIDSTISGNVAFDSSGGGINNSGTLTMVNSTVSGNMVKVGGSGGGIANSSSLTMADDTVAANTAAGSGGGIANLAPSGGYLSLSNTIVADNLSTSDSRTDDLIDSGDVANSQLVGGYDLIGSGDLGALQNPLTGVDPELGALQNNGGRTQTMALLPNSPAIGAGDAAIVPMGTWTDQRGWDYWRFSNGVVDIGAFEFQAAGPVLRGQRPLPPLSVNPDVVGAGIGLTITIGDYSGKLHRGLDRPATEPTIASST
jgi:hypothetical protein